MYESGLPGGKWKDEGRGLRGGHEIEEEDEIREQDVTLKLQAL